MPSKRKHTNRGKGEGGRSRRANQPSGRKSKGCRAKWRTKWKSFKALRACQRMGKCLWGTRKTVSVVLTGFSKCGVRKRGEGRWWGLWYKGRVSSDGRDKPPLGEGKEIWSEWFTVTGVHGKEGGRKKKRVEVKESVTNFSGLSDKREGGGVQKKNNRRQVESPTKKKGWGPRLGVGFHSRITKNKKNSTNKSQREKKGKLRTPIRKQMYRGV